MGQQKPPLAIYSKMYEYIENSRRCYYEKIRARKDDCSRFLYSTEVDFREGWKDSLEGIKKYFEIEEKGEISTRELCLSLF